MKRRFFLKAAATALVGFSLFKKTETAILYPVEFKTEVPWEPDPTLEKIQESWRAWCKAEQDAIENYFNKLKAAQY